MATDSLVRIAEHFRELALSQGTAGPIGEVISWLALDGPPLDGFDRIVEGHGVRRTLWFRKQVADLIISFVSRVRAPRPMSDEQLVEVELLKEALRVREGELVEHRPAEIAALLHEEVDIALADGRVDEREDLQLVRLQIAFDLGYDEFLSLCRISIERGIQALSDEAMRLTDASGVADLEMKIADLTPLARLARLQRRSLGALY